MAEVFKLSGSVREGWEQPLPKVEHVEDSLWYPPPPSPVTAHSFYNRYLGSQESVFSVEWDGIVSVDFRIEFGYGPDQRLTVWAGFVKEATGGGVLAPSDLKLVEDSATSISFAQVFQSPGLTDTSGTPVYFNVHVHHAFDGYTTGNTDLITGNSYISFAEQGSE